MRVSSQEKLLDEPGNERDRVAASLPTVERITLRNTGHFSSLEKPDDVARILLDAKSS